MMCRVLSARTCSLRFPRVGLESGNDAVEVAEYLAVHLGEAGLAARFGGGDDLQDLLAVLAVQV